MLSIQELYGNLKEYESKLKWYKKNRDEKKNISLALKVVNSFDNDEEKFNEAKIKDEENEMALLSKKF